MGVINFLHNHSGITFGILGGLGYLIYQAYFILMSKYSPVKYIEFVSDKFESLILVLDKQVDRLKKNPLTNKIGKDLEARMIEVINHNIENLNRIKEVIIKE